MTIHKLCKDVKMENQNIIQTIATILQGIESHLADISMKLDSMQEFEKEKRTKKEKENIYNLGGIIGGESIGGLRGKREGGNKGGEFNPDLMAKKNSESALASFNADEHAILDKLNQSLFAHLKDEYQISFLMQREQKILGLKAIRKLMKLKYNSQMMEQALYNAFRDEFWNNKLRHVKALANTLKNGELLIANLLKKNQAQTKINAPVKAQFKG